METIHRALVAEDDRALADIIRLSLSRGGYEVSVAHDGKKALALATSNRFEVVVSDYQMPLLNGEQLLRGIRAEGASVQALLFLCSAKSFELDSERLQQELELSAVFFKPFSLGELVSTIKSIHQSAVA